MVRNNPMDNPFDNPMLSPIGNPKDNPKLSPIDNPKDNPRLSPIDNPKDNPKLSPIDNPKDNPIKRPMPNTPGEVAGVMIVEIMKYQFAVYDIALYLDTHPNDMRAKMVHKEYAKILHDMIIEFEEVHGPISLLSHHGDYSKYVNEPWPWEIRY